MTPGGTLEQSLARTRQDMRLLNVGPASYSIPKD